MKIIIINGVPKSGKDEFVSICKSENLPYVLNISTVDFVKEIASACGWDGTKDEHNRKFLSDLKKLLTEWNEVPIKKIEEKIFEFKEKIKKNNLDLDKIIIFIHCREPKEIDKLVKKFNAQTLLIRRHSAELENHSNDSDLNVFNYNYNYVVYNNGTLEDLRNSAKEFLNLILK